MTFKHSRFTSRIDRCYSNLEDSSLFILCPKAWTLDHHVESDHKPLVCELKGEYNSGPNGFTPSWAFTSKRFKDAVYETLR